MKHRVRCLMVAGGLFCMSMVSMGAVNVAADSTEIVFTEEETTESSSEDKSEILARGAILSFGSAKISKVSNEEVGLFGLTQCYEVSDLVSLNMYLERKVDGHYYTYKSWDFYEQNAHHVGQEMTVLVPKETFYRLRTYHYAKKGVTRESTEALTKGIYIGNNYSPNNEN